MQDLEYEYYKFTRNFELYGDGVIQYDDCMVNPPNLSCM